MTFRASETLLVRGTEIGFTGVVQPGTFSRHCEWARWAMFRDEGTRERVRLGNGVARAQSLELLADVSYPSTLRIETTISRAGRTSLDILHTVLRLDDEAIVARCRTTIVQLGENGPSPLDPSLAACVTPDEGPRTPEFDDGPPEFETTIVVRPSDQDQFRHVNQARYVDFADDIRWNADSAGNDAGFAGALGAVAIDYRREAKAGMVLRAAMRRGSDDSRSIRLVDAESGVETTRIVVVPRPR